MKLAALWLILASALLAEPDCPKGVFLIVVGKTGSMLPTLKEGDVRAVQPVKIDDLKVGDLIVWRWEAVGENVIHRVWKIAHFGNGQKFVVSKGDHNKQPDSLLITQKQLRGIVK